ncbi:MAG: acyl-ACP--UDP-N-acetylglucosamine O-acyltransferase [Candidatus Omnitrophica bacterium]|nr:acyl-ACP--UDP-N-acetylglucosamine O-acyltransferase [Candidatus Omnitrophota bacterium]
MTVSIHPTAIVHPEAVLADDVVIGPFSCIGAKVKIGGGTTVAQSCVIDGDTSIGANCEIYQGASIGLASQDLKYKNEPAKVIIGNNNRIREYVTIHRGTAATGQTKIGSDNLLMAYVHVAHDCVVGNECVFANAATLGGHVEVADQVMLGGLSAVHQFVTVGTRTILGGGSKLASDGLPYAIYDGHPARFRGMNIEGLKRRGVSAEVRSELRKAFHMLFDIAGGSRVERLDAIEKAYPGTEEIRNLVAFARASKRGIGRPARGTPE